MGTLDQFDFAASDGIHRVAIFALARGEWIERGDNSSGRSAPASSRHRARQRGGSPAAPRRILARRRPSVRSLAESRDTHDLGRQSPRLDRVALLVLDELSFVPFGRTAGELLFGVIAQRYERRSVFVTSNLTFSECAKGPRRRREPGRRRSTDHDCSTIVSTNGKSYRMRRRCVMPLDP